MTLSVPSEGFSIRGYTLRLERISLSPTTPIFRLRSELRLSPVPRSEDKVEFGRTQGSLAVVAISNTDSTSPLDVDGDSKSLGGAFRSLDGRLEETRMSGRIVFTVRLTEVREVLQYIPARTAVETTRKRATQGKHRDSRPIGRALVVYAHTPA